VPEVQTITFRAGSAFTAREFRKTKQAINPKLAPVALDILVAPVSQAYVERLFSVCGLLCSGRRNRMTRSLTESLFEDEYGRFAFTWCSVTDSEKSECKMPIIILIHLID